MFPINEEIKDYIQNYYDVYFGINAVYENWAKAHGLTSNELFTLYTIHQFPDHCTQRFICEKLLCPKQTINSILNYFSKEGYIQKIVLAEDKRNKYILLTEEGQKYADGILTELLHFEEMALSNMDSDNKSSMIKSQRAFLEQLTKVFHSPK